MGGNLTVTIPAVIPASTPVKAAVALALLLLPGCGAPPPPPPGPRPAVVAHRGGALEAPENTVLACRRAIDLGFEWVEIDVRLTRDGIPVVLHDESPARTAGVASAPAVRDLTRSELRRYVVLGEGGPEARGEPVPDLAEVLALPWGKTRLMAELKREPGGGPELRPGDRALVQVTMAEIDRSGRTASVVIASFSPVLLAEVHRVAPARPLIGIAGKEPEIGPLLALGPSRLALNRELVTSARCLDLTARGVEVWAWTVREAGEVGPLLASGAAGIITDIPSTVRRLLED